MKKILRHRYTRWVMFPLFGAFLLWYATCLPEEPFESTFSTVLLDKDGKLVGAQIAADGQWRFKGSDSVPRKFERCLLEFEDRNFHSHIGISARGIGRAIVQNVRNRRLVSGGSTLTMQLARIMRKRKGRGVGAKFIEMIIATRMEIRYSKRELLLLYAGNAPFGNNVVGLDAAAWRYYGRPPHALTWAECATLAVLPNAPGLIYPGRNQQRLLEKRNRLLARLHDENVIDRVTYKLALHERLPGKPLPLPRTAPHLLTRLAGEGHKGNTTVSSIDINLQERANAVLASHHARLSDNKIFNGAIIIVSVKTGKVRAYVGNTNSLLNEHGNNVNCITAPRSTGSILKPFLYCSALEDGQITPSMLIPDVPTQYGNFTPRNFTKLYDGAVAANKALSRSLNIPFVRMLNEYGIGKFRRELKDLGLTTIRKPAEHYGLSLILGGAEARLDELTAAYASLAQRLNNIEPTGLSLLESTEKSKRKKKRRNRVHSRAAIYSTLMAMVDVNRPDEDGNWRAFSSAQKIAWKTGTSFGSRDAWAIGVTGDYAVGVWIGNADGEGRPGLTGIQAAAPVLFDVFGLLPRNSNWFREPAEEMSEVPVCAESGHRASSLCVAARKEKLPSTSLRTTACPYHQLVHLSADRKYRVSSECASTYNMKHEPWFILPPLIEKYYRFNHPGYRALPEFHPACKMRMPEHPMTLIYPSQGSRIYVPIEIDGKTGRTVFEATHRNPEARIYWHLDEKFIGESREIHQVALHPSPGKHKLALVDEYGVTVSVSFEITVKSDAEFAALE